MKYKDFVKEQKVAYLETGGTKEDFDNMEKAGILKHQFKESEIYKE